MDLDVTVAATVPVEVSVNDLVIALPSGTSPNESEEALMVSDGADFFEAFRWIATVFDDSFSVAETVMVCAALTAATVAENDAAVDLAGIVTLPGTFTALPLEASSTLSGLDAGAVTDTVHLVFPEFENEVLSQASALIPGVEAAFAGGVRTTENVFTILPCVAVMMPVWFELTGMMPAVNVALVWPSGIVTETGTLIAAMLLDNWTSNPPEAAAVLVVTVQESEPDPDTLEPSHFKPLNSGVRAEAEPFPCRLTIAAGVVADALLITLSCPVRSVASPGVK